MRSICLHCQTFGFV